MSALRFDPRGLGGAITGCFGWDALATIFKTRRRTPPMGYFLWFEQLQQLRRLRTCRQADSIRETATARQVINFPGTLMKAETAKARYREGCAKKTKASPSRLSSRPSRFRGLWTHLCRR